MFSLALLAAVALNAGKTTPIVVPATMYYNVFLVTGKVQGVNACFAVDTGADRTFIQGGIWLLGPHKLDLEIGDEKLSDVTVLEEKMPILDAIRDAYTSATNATLPISGVLGRDILSKFAIGFDFNSQSISLWKGGKLSPDKARDWIDWLPRWPGTQQPSLKTTPLTMIQDCYCLKVTSHGVAANLMIDSGTYRTVVNSPLAEASAPIVADKIENSFAMGDATCELRISDHSTVGKDLIPWWAVLCVGPDAQKLQGVPVAGRDGAIALTDFRSRKVILDLPAKKAYSEAFDEEGQLSMALSRAIDTPIYIDESKLRLGPIDSSSTVDWVRPYEDSQVIAIGDMPADEILAALRGTSADPTGKMAKLMKLTQTTYKLRIVNRGKPIELKIER